MIRRMGRVLVDLAKGVSLTISEFNEENRQYDSLKHIFSILNRESTFYRFYYPSQTEQGRQRIDEVFTEILVNWLIDRQMMMTCSQSILDTANETGVPYSTTQSLANTLTALKIALPNNSYYARASEAIDLSHSYLTNIIVRAAFILDIPITDMDLLQAAELIQERLTSIAENSSMLVPFNNSVCSTFDDYQREYQHHTLNYFNLPRKIGMEAEG